MPKRTAVQTDSAQRLELRDPAIAALLAFLLPGLGHFYQRRAAKGVLFSVSILTVFFYGLFLGEGRVVYAAWGPQEIRWPYFCQVGVGLPALPALVQFELVRSGKRPFFDKSSRFMVPPDPGDPARGTPSELHLLHKRLNRYFELGTVYTMIAGLLNMLVIYDAWGGPAFALRRTRDQEEALASAAEAKRPPPATQSP
jgi:hypothetical protein